MEELMHGRSAVLPVLSYLFRRLEDRFDGPPALLVLDEAWIFLDDPAFAGACIDVSDGFLQDLRHLCAASGVGAVVECSRLPLGSAARALPDGMELALSGGEHYALLLSFAVAQHAISPGIGRG